MVVEEPLNGGEDYNGDEQEPHAKQEEEAATEEVVTFGEADEQEEQVTGFMLKTPGQLEQQLVSFEPESNVDPAEDVQQKSEERETSVDTGEEVQGNENKDQADLEANLCHVVRIEAAEIERADQKLSEKLLCFLPSL